MKGANKKVDEQKIDKDNLSSANQQNQRLESIRPSGIRIERGKQSNQLFTQNNLRKSQNQPQPSSNNPNQANSKQLSANLSSLRINQLIQTFKIKQISTRTYKQVIQQIAQSFTTLDNITLTLQQKVDYMLKQQQNQFVSSYISHMKKIKQEFSSVDKKIQQFQKKIQYYQNQGEMSHLVIKVNKLQNQCKNLYKDISQKNKINKDYQLTIKVQKSEIKRYQKEIKLLMREKNQMILRTKEKQEEDRIKNYNSSEDVLINSQKNVEAEGSSPREILPATFRNNMQSPANSNSNTKILASLFPTQLLDLSQTKNHDLSTQYHLGSIKSKQHLFLINKSSQKSLTLDLSSQKSPNHPSQHHQISLLSKVRQMQLKKQVSSLKKRNKLLNSFQSYILDAKTDMESFFIQCVNQLKQQIRIRKKINQCSFEQFKKEDKIELLIKIISNDDILAYLYERIFKKKRLFGNGDMKENSQKILQKDCQNDYYGQQNTQKSKKNKSLQKLIQTNHLSIKSPSQIRNTLRFQIGARQKQKMKTSQKQYIKNQMMGLAVDTISRQKRQQKKQQKQQKKKKSSSVAKRRFSKHISQNTLLPKIHFHLQY